MRDISWLTDVRVPCGGLFGANVRGGAYNRHLTYIRCLNIRIMSARLDLVPEDLPCQSCGEVGHWTVDCTHYPNQRSSSSESEDSSSDEDEEQQPDGETGTEAAPPRRRRRAYKTSVDIRRSKFIKGCISRAESFCERYSKSEWEAHISAQAQARATAQIEQDVGARESAPSSATETAAAESNATADQPADDEAAQSGDPSVAAKKKRQRPPFVEPEVFMCFLSPDGKWPDDLPCIDPNRISPDVAWSRSFLEFQQRLGHAVELPPLKSNTRNSDKGLQPLRGTQPQLPARGSNLDGERAALLDVDVDASNAIESEHGTSTVASGSGMAAGTTRRRVKSRLHRVTRPGMTATPIMREGLAHLFGGDDEGLQCQATLLQYIETGVAPTQKIGQEDLDYTGIGELEQPQYRALLEGLIGSIDVFTEDALLPLRGLLCRPGDSEDEEEELEAARRGKAPVMDDAHAPAGVTQPSSGAAQGCPRPQRTRLPTWRAAEGTAAGRSGAPMAPLSAREQRSKSKTVLASLIAPIGGEPHGDVLRLLCVDTTYPVPSHIRGLLPTDEATVTSLLKDPSAAKAIITWTDAEVSRRCMAGKGGTKELLIQIVINGTQRMPATLNKAELEGWLRVRGISFAKNARPMTLIQKVVHHLAALANDNENQITVLNRLKNIISRHKPNPS
ncbi:hypothetical protein COCOBI_04-8380 [Coccomyxa sp. Obi]|nr:hypothetical protein COCOBI_04-8380 [Coccomyxa sp. Obi]